MVRRCTLTVSILVFVLGTSIALPGQTHRRITTRYDVRRTVNNRYQGLVYGEYRFSLISESPPDLRIHQYNLEKLAHDGRLEKRLVETVASAPVTVDDRGVIQIPEEEDVLLFQNIPAPPPEPVAVGESWQALGAVLVDPLDSGEMTRIPIIAEYRLRGEGTYGEQAVWVVDSLFALRYRGGDPYGDPKVVSAQGRHQSVIYYTKDWQPLFFRSTVEEQFGIQGGGTVENRGFFLTWYEYLAALPRQEITRELQARVDAEELKDVNITQVAEGIRVSLENLLFIADQSLLLPGEQSRLEAISRILGQYPDRNILITGHTADVGTQESQQELSEQRARVIADELIRRGIEARRIIYRGVGGLEPVADNQTEQGRQKNRRVEILLLEN